MATNTDIYRSAKLLIDQHQDGAELHATMRADELLEAGDIEGQRTWLSILEAVKELLNLSPTGTLH